MSEQRIDEFADVERAAVAASIALHVRARSFGKGAIDPQRFIGRLLLRVESIADIAHRDADRVLCHAIEFVDGRHVLLADQELTRAVPQAWEQILDGHRCARR
jgi:hypothetical protein